MVEQDQEDQVQAQEGVRAREEDEDVWVEPGMVRQEIVYVHHADIQCHIKSDNHAIILSVRNAAV